MARKRRKTSRLARKEGKRMMRQTWMLVILTFVILFSLFKWGLPALINMAAFLGDLRASSQPIGQADTIAPTPPRLEQLPIATASARLSLAGYTEANVIVKLYRSGSELSETSSDDSGDFRFVDIRLEEDENTFYAVASDSAGNESEQSNRVSIGYDIKAPELSIDTPSDGQDFFGDSKRTLTVSGSTDPDAEVRINDRFAVVSANGQFSTTIQLSDGSNTITARAIDDAGNTTETSVTVTYAP